MRIRIHFPPDVNCGQYAELFWENIIQFTELWQKIICPIGEPVLKTHIILGLLLRFPARYSKLKASIIDLLWLHGTSSVDKHPTNYFEYGISFVLYSATSVNKMDRSRMHCAGINQIFNQITTRLFFVSLKLKGWGWIFPTLLFPIMTTCIIEFY